MFKKSPLPKKKTVSNKIITKNAATPIKPTTSPMTIPNQTKPIAQNPTTASSSNPSRPIKAQAKQNAISIPAFPP